MGSEFEEQVREFKKVRKIYNDDSSDEKINKTCLLGRSYWRGFLKRHKQEIETATGSPLNET